MSLDDMVKSAAPKKGKGGAGGKAVAGGRGGARARAAAAPYQKPVGKGKGKGKGGGKGLADLMHQEAPVAETKPQPQFVLTTGTTLRVGNLDYNVSQEDITELFGELGALKSAELMMRPDGKSKGFAFVTYKRKVDAETALEKYNGVPLDGKALKITLQQKVQNMESAAATAIELVS